MVAHCFQAGIFAFATFNFCLRACHCKRLLWGNVTQGKAMSFKRVLEQIFVSSQLAGVKIVSDKQMLKLDQYHNCIFTSTELVWMKVILSNGWKFFFSNIFASVVDIELSLFFPSIQSTNACPPWFSMKLNKKSLLNFWLKLIWCCFLYILISVFVQTSTI